MKPPVWSLLIIIEVFSLAISGSSTKNNLLDIRKNIFGEDYGKKWMYFPDGENNLHVINLTEPTMFLDYRLERNLEFILYLKDQQKNISLDEFAVPSQDEMLMSDTLSKSSLKIITHGWMASANTSSVMDITNAYLKSDINLNVITIDWSSYSKNMNYPMVAKQTREVGYRIASFLSELYKRYNINGDQIHLIGHSLGAHVMGISGYESKLLIGRITGLDPALPLFSKIQTSKTRLDYNDAKFVDVIHTCGGILGFWDAIGTADFYPNKGLPPQPGCSLYGIIQLDACSHSRSHTYFAESVLNSKAFQSYRCNYWTDDVENCFKEGYMGEGATKKMSGRYVLFTNSKEPYGKSL